MYYWNRMPFVRLLLPLIAGILSAVFLEVDTGLFLVFLILGFMGTCLILSIQDFRLTLRLKLLHSPLIFMAIWGLAGLLTLHGMTIHSDEHFSEYSDSEMLLVEIEEHLTEKDNSFRTVVQVDATLGPSRWQKSEGRLLVYLAKDSLVRELEIGDEILIPKQYRSVDGPANPGEFNYKRFLSFRDIYHQQFVREGSWALVQKDPDLFTWAERIRTSAIAMFDDAGFDQDQKAIASALVLGKKDHLSADLIHAYAGAGAMHVLAVSGLHVGILFMVLSFLLSPIKKGRSGVIYHSLVILIMLWVFAFITGLSPSVVRASTMFSAIAIARMLKRTSNIYNTIAASAFVLLLVNPFYIMEVGFQLSYLAVVGIIFLQPKLKSLLYFKGLIASKVWEVTCVSLAAQIATFPLGLLYFHQFPTYFLFSNLIVIPAATLILVLGFSYLVLWWVPFLGEVLGQGLKWTIYGLNLGVERVQLLPHSLIEGVNISIVETWILYVLIVLVSMAFIYRRKNALIGSLALFCLLMASRLTTELEFRRHLHLTVYDVNRASAVNLVNNECNLLITDSTTWEDEGKKRFHFQNNWNLHGAPEPVLLDKTEANELMVSSGLFEFAGRSFALVDSWECLLDFEEPLEVDYLVLSYFRGVDMDRVLEHFHPRTIIIDSTVGAKKARYLLAELPSHQKVHTVVFDGYFEERLYPDQLHD